MQTSQRCGKWLSEKRGWLKVGRERERILFDDEEMEQLLIRTRRWKGECSYQKPFKHASYFATAGRQGGYFQGEFIQSRGGARTRTRRSGPRSGGDTNWFAGRRMKARRGPVKGMKRKLFNDLVRRARFLSHRASSSFFTAVPTLLRERCFRIDSLKRATVFSDFSLPRYLHIKISLTPSLKIILRLPFFLLPPFPPPSAFSTLMRSRRISLIDVGKEKQPALFVVL